ncbi:MAG: HD domain-containing protein [Thermodesulfobacteriota bacterium]|nr:HD domain-containing protein [Thermodesulfobacteriota bacterium]
MKQIYADLRDVAREIAAGYPEPDFYSVFSASAGISMDVFETTPLLSVLQETVRQYTNDNLGHGMGHARKVALDAGTIAAAEALAADYSSRQARQVVLLAQCAGLLHDMERRHKDHAVKGAKTARQTLNRESRLNGAEIDIIAFAIRNHEAFKPVTTPRAMNVYIISGSLYDADKFRWGPDNFTHTLWQMIETLQPPLSTLVQHYPGAMDHIAAIKPTFRTEVGRVYGPQFIDIGLAIGRELLEIIQTQYAEYF